jgi:apolipoprotein N-acyltransferase
VKDSHKTGDGFRQQWVPVLAAVLASSGMYVFSTGLHPTGWLTWLAPLPILLVAFRLSWRAAFAAAFLACFIGQLNMLGYLLRLVPLGPLLVFLAVPALVFALGVLFARGTVRRTESWLAVLAFPVAWTAYEFLLALASPNGTFGSVAYSQVELLPVIQVASLTGIAGITFLLTLVPSALAVAWRLRRRRATAGKALAAGLVPLVLVLSFGWFRLAGSAGGPSIRVGLAATDRTVGRFCTEDRAEAIPVVEDYARRVGDLAARGAGVVVLPEKFVGVAPAYAAEVYKLLSATARMNRVAVIAGLNWVGISPRRNVAVVFSPDGRYVEYDKVHFVPGLEMGYCSGIRPLILPLAGIPAGVAVCKDMDFPAWTRRWPSCGGWREALRWGARPRRVF